jgi:Ser-tRNA(Ala) deacylase AlaX
MTDLLFLQDFDVVSVRAAILVISKTEDDRIDIVLDKTCFYARGGGQDWDIGIISSDTGDFTIEEVRLDQEGTVHHIGVYGRGELKVDQSVECNVDKGRRSINTRLHSGGHVIDMAVASLGLDWVGTKGQHYPELCAVEYSGLWKPEKAEELRAAIESNANKLVKASLDNRIVFTAVDEMHKLCRHVPENLPKNKPGRVVMYGEDFGIPCGGTHVKNLNEVGEIRVSKLKEKKGVIRLNYEVVGINA